MLCDTVAEGKSFGFARIGIVRNIPTGSPMAADALHLPNKNKGIVFVEYEYKTEWRKLLPAWNRRM